MGTTFLRSLVVTLTQVYGNMLLTKEKEDTINELRSKNTKASNREADKVKELLPKYTANQYNTVVEDILSIIKKANKEYHPDELRNPYVENIEIEFDKSELSDINISNLETVLNGFIVYVYLNGIHYCIDSFICKEKIQVSIANKFRFLGTPSKNLEFIISTKYTNGANKILENKMEANLNASKA